MKPLRAACLLCVAIVVACSPIVDRRLDTERVATQTARAVLPLPPLPHSIRVQIKPMPTAALLPTVTRTPAP